MTPDSFDRQIEAARQRLAALARRAREPGAEDVLTLEALEELSTALEELHVAGGELREQNEELAASRGILEGERRRYQELFEFAPDGYLVTDAEGVIREANSAAAALLGVQQDFLVGKPLSVFVPEAQQVAYHTRLNEIREETGHVRDWELSLQPRGGAVFSASLTVGTVRDAAGRLTGLRWLVRDISDHKRMEEEVHRSRKQLRELAAYLESAREVERSRMAHQLHDELTQGLTGLKFDLAWLAGKLAKDQPALLDKTRAMLTDIQGMVGMTREFSTELRPSLLNDLGLVAASDWLVQDFRSRTGIACEFESRLTDLEPSREQSTALFRICQEALSIAAVSPGVTKVAVRLLAHATHVSLSVEDNGKGPPEIANVTSLALLRMRERALALGGEVTSVVRPGEGSTVTVTIPLTPR